MTGRPAHGRPTVRQLVAAYRAADKALQDNAEHEQAVGIGWETEEFHRLNDEVWVAQRALPWWLRWVFR